MRGLNTNMDFLLSNQLDVEMLDRLSSHVEAGNLQTVVDKVIKNSLRLFTMFNTKNFILGIRIKRF